MKDKYTMLENNIFAILVIDYIRVCKSVLTNSYFIEIGNTFLYTIRLNNLHSLKTLTKTITYLYFLLIPRAKLTDLFY